MRGLVVLVLLCGCIEESLVPCGDISCPQGDSCVSDRCVSAQQLAACAGHSDGDSCTVDHTGGTCASGTCVVQVCGDGVIEPGEVCDDGNRTSGDGCNNTCTSAETCGNGIVDATEECDCGSDAAHQAAGCLAPNSLGPDSNCDPQCHIRYCGDGSIGLGEQCDGSVPADMTCADYGYYRGSVTCDNCQFSVKQCSGRCGDGVIDTASGEYCDQVLPADASCVAYGFDLGPLTCGIGCGADFTGCTGYGWQHIGPVTAAGRSVWGGPVGLAALFSTQEAWAYAGGTWSKAPDTYDFVTGTATTLWAVGSDHLASWTPAGGWQSLTPAWPPGTPLTSVWASDALGLFVARGDVVPLDRYLGGTWTTVDGGWSAGAQLIATRTNLYIPLPGGGATYFDGTTWNDVPGFEYYTVYGGSEDEAGRVWLQTSAGLLVGGPGNWTPSNIGGAAAFAPGDGGMFLANVDHAAGNTYEDLWFDGQPPMHLSVVPAGDENASIAVVGNQLFATDTGGLDVLARGAWRQYDTSIGVNPVALRGGPLVETPYGGATYGGAAVEVLDETDTLSPLAMPDDNCTTAGVKANGDVLASCGTGLFEAGVNVEPGFSADLLWSSPDSTAAAASTDGVFAWGVHGVWQTLFTNMHFDAMDGDAITDLFATDATGLWHFDGTGWSQLASDAHAPLVVTPTRVYAGSSQGPIMLTRATGVIVAAPMRPGTTGFAGTGGEELFAIAPAEPRGSPLWHYDGTSWWPLRLPADMPFISSILAYGRNLLLFPGQSSPAEPPAYWLERTATW